MGFENENLKMKRELEARTRLFAVAVFQMLRLLPNDTSTRVISFQLGKSASSIGANYREANRAESRADFLHKIGIVLKEASETCYWLEILADLNPDIDTLKHLQSEVGEFVRIFQATHRSIVHKDRANGDPKS